MRFSARSAVQQGRCGARRSSRLARPLIRPAARATFSRKGRRKNLGGIGLSGAAPDAPVEAAGAPAERRVWRLRALALAAGAGTALAHPPFGLLPGLLGYPLLLWLVDRADGGRPLRSAFFTGWLAGAAFFAISLWWVAE